jgi:hypothetical protein
MARAEETNFPESITLGRHTYENVRVTKVTPAAITIFHRTGVVKIPLQELPAELQEKFGYDPARAEQYRREETKARAAWEQAEQRRLQLRRQAQAEADQRRQLEGAATDFHCAIIALNEKGLIVRTAKTLFQNSAKATAASATETAPIEITYALLVGHPQQASLAVGDTISCRAYRDGVEEINGESLPRWVYVGKAQHPIPAPPPQTPFY